MQQRFHDFRLVCPPEGTEQQALTPCGAPELGNRAAQVPVPGARQPDRLHRVERRSTENHAGGHHSLGIRAFFDTIPARAAEAGLPVGGLVPGGRGVFHVPGAAGLSHRRIADLPRSLRSVSRQYQGRRHYQDTIGQHIEMPANTLPGVQMVLHDYGGTSA